MRPHDSPVTFVVPGDLHLTEHGREDHRVAPFYRGLMHSTGEQPGSSESAQGLDRTKKGGGSSVVDPRPHP